METLNVHELQCSVSTKIVAWRPGDQGTFMKLYLRPGAYLGGHFYIFELNTKFRIAWYQKRECCKFIEMVGFLIYSGSQMKQWPHWRCLSTVVSVHDVKKSYDTTANHYTS